MYTFGVAAGYNIEFETSAVKALAKIQRSVRIKIATAIKALAVDPRPHGCLKMSGRTDAYRIRVGRDYRVVYTVRDTVRVIRIEKIAHRREVYR